MRENAVAGLAVTVALALSLMACQDTKARQENEQLKAHVLELQKELGQMGNRVDQATTARDSLMKENATLRDENKRLKTKRPGTKTPKSKRRRSQTYRRPA
jgi:regulator of replication initiation timing